MFATSDKSLQRTGISCFGVPVDAPGITRTWMYDKLGQRAADAAEAVFEEVKIPRTGLVGPSALSYTWLTWPPYSFFFSPSKSVMRMP